MFLGNLLEHIHQFCCPFTTYVFIQNAIKPVMGAMVTDQIHVQLVLKDTR